MFTSCLCWTDIRRAISGIGIFAMVTSTVQILVTVAVFTGVNAVSPVMFNAAAIGQVSYNVYIMYIALSCADFLVVLFSLFMLCGNERLVNGKGGRHYFYLWLLYIPIYMMYEIGINIYYFYYAFTTLNSSGSIAMPLGFSIVPLCYWAVKEMLLFLGYVIVFRHVQPCHNPHPVVLAASTYMVPARPTPAPAPVHTFQQVQQTPLYAYQPAQPVIYQQAVGVRRF